MPNAVRRGVLVLRHFKGASFLDMVALKGKSDIGDRINKEIDANTGPGTSG